MKRFILCLLAVLLSPCIGNTLVPSTAYGQQQSGKGKTPKPSDELLRGQKQWIVFDLTNTPSPPSAKTKSINISSAWVCSAKLSKDDYAGVAANSGDQKPCRHWPKGADFYFQTGTLLYIELFPPDDSTQYSLAHTDVQIVAESAAPSPQNAAESIHGAYDPIVLFLGQYTANTRVSFTVCAGPGSCGAAPKQSNPAKAQTPPAPAPAPAPTNTCCPNGTACCCCCTCNQTPAPQGGAGGGTSVANGDIEVHKVEHGNLVGGFFISSLPNQQYGITNNGQSTTVTYVAVVGPSVRPQYHAFTGLDIDFFGRDTFPGGAGKQHFFGIKRSHLDGYWNPNILVGYGVDATNNYLLGANWVTKWGVDLGGGLHIGQITQLQPGIIPGLTVLPSAATSPPTYNRVGYGRYISIGFDLNTIKSAISLFGGGKVATP